jgi:hypothetical protein
MMLRPAGRAGLGHGERLSHTSGRAARRSQRAADVGHASRKAAWASRSRKGSGTGLRAATSAKTISAGGRAKLVSPLLKRAAWPAHFASRDFLEEMCSTHP